MKSQLPKPGLLGPDPVPSVVRRVGACAKAAPDLFDIDDAASDPEGAAAARAVCVGCSVRELCLAYALSNEPYGIWGGRDAREREQIRGWSLLTPEERRESELLVWQLTHGRTAGEVADRYEVSVRTIERWKRKAGVELKPAGGVEITGREAA